ncbi:uncharacterized protein [Palaemon carinicauda]|uniref:uncharacterized protein n=1 Tax=Palaemon carinicauda TaxID=392227 RepID=UPI0035B698C7
MASGVISTVWKIYVAPSVTLWFMYRNSMDELSVDIKEDHKDTQKDTYFIPLRNLSMNVWHQMELQMGSQEEERKFSIDIAGLTKWAPSRNIYSSSNVWLTADGQIELYNENHTSPLRTPLLAEVLLVIAGLLIVYLLVDLALKCRARRARQNTENQDMSAKDDEIEDGIYEEAEDYRRSVPPFEHHQPAPIGRPPPDVNNSYHYGMSRNIM